MVDVYAAVGIKFYQCDDRARETGGLNALEMLQVGYGALIALSFTVALLIVFYTLKNGIPPMPTTRYLCEQTAEVLRRYVKPDDVPLEAMEAGSGWGTLALYLSRRFVNLTFVGIENSPVPYLFSRILQAMLRRRNCRFVRADLYTHNISHCQVMICYLFAGAMQKLKNRLLEQSGEHQHKIIISIFFAIPGWQPSYVHQCNDLYRTKIYVYETEKNIPLTGRW